nr:nicotinate (nicotinamide) nucleotide adenylyltransferase [Alteromonas sp. ASW11-130]
MLGGTFNPPHYGHIQPAIAAIEIIGAEKLGLMPCKVPPHKQLAEVNQTHRVKMTELACSVDPRLYTELCELSLPAPSYSVKTFQALRALYPQTALLFLMGEDSFYHLTSWYKWQMLTDYCHIVVMRRKGCKPPLPVEQKKWLQNSYSEVECGKFESISGNVYLVDTPYFTVSSTLIRQELANYFHAGPVAAKEIEHKIIKWLPPQVFDYIKANRLYDAVIT